MCSSPHFEAPALRLGPTAKELRTSPWLDLACTHSSVITNSAGDPYIPVHRIADLAALLRGADEDPLESLLDADLSALPPVLIQVGSIEVLLSDAELMTAALAAAGVPVRLQVWQRQVHVFQAFADMVAEGHLAIDEIGQFVRASGSATGSASGSATGSASGGSAGGATGRGAGETSAA